jgi:hypothetical protein
MKLNDTNISTYKEINEINIILSHVKTTFRCQIKMHAYIKKNY